MPIRTQLNPVQIIVAFFWYIPITLLVYLHIRRNRRFAWTHKLEAQAYVLLPIYDYFIYYDFIKYLVRFIFFGFFHDWTTDVIPEFTGCSWAEVIFIVVATDLGEVVELSLVLHFLLGKSSGRRAVIESLQFTGIFASTYFLTRILIIKFTEGETYFILTALCSSVVLLFLLGCIIRMCKYDFSRWQSSLYYYVTLYIFLWSLIMVSSIFGMHGVESAVTILVTFFFVFDFFIPLLRYKVLIEDSQYWRSFRSHLLPDEDKEQSLLANDHLQNSPQLSGLHDLERGLDTAAETLRLLEVPIIDYTFLQSSHQFLGMGGSAIVWQAQVKGKDVAVKELLNRDLNFWDLTKFCREVLLSTSLKHENIVRFHGLIVCPPCILLIYDWCNLGDLDKYLNSVSDGQKPGLPLAARYHLAFQAARGLEFFHSKGYVHRDIKPQNFLVHQEANTITVKIADFGSARSKHDEVHILSGITPVFTPPELIKVLPKDFIQFGIRGHLKSVVVKYGPEMDVYSFGWVLCRIMFEPFAYFKEQNLQQEQIFEHVQKGWLPDISKVDLKYQEVIQLCWTADPHYRPSAEMIRSLLENRLDCVTGGKLIFEISA